MKKLHLSNDLSLPIEAVTQRISILGRTGSGKSYTAAVLVEEVLKAHQQVVVLDPKGDWWGLRSSANGKSAGLPITIMGGEHGDVPLEPTAGALVADIIISEGISVILDLSLFDSKADEIRFATAFLDRLYRKNKRPLLFVCDEADVFAPQKPEKNETTMLNRMETVCRRGRSKGIGVVLVSQRSAALHKGCLSQTELMIAHQTTAPQDKKAIEFWVVAHGDEKQRKFFMETITQLEKGHAIVWSPSWLNIFEAIKVRAKETYDSSQTPRVGVRRRAPKVLAQVDLERLKKHMAATIEKMKQDDPKLLRDEIKRLHAQLNRPAVSAPTVNVEALKREIEKWKKQPHVAVIHPKTVVKPVILKKELDRLEKLEAELMIVKSKERGVVDNIEGLLRTLTVKVHAAFKAQDVFAPSVQVEPFKPVKMKMTVASYQPDTRILRGGSRHNGPVIPLRIIPSGHAGPPPEGEEKPLKGERDILESLITFAKPLNQDQIGVFKGIKPKGTTLSTYLNRLRRRGWITNNGDLWELTDDGATVAASYFPNTKHPTTEEILALWRKRLLAGERAILDEAVKVFPEPISLQKISEALGIRHTGSTISTYVNRLRRNCLIEVKTHGGMRMITASQDLFQEVMA